jgi:alanine dehydrogenase
MPFTRRKEQEPARGPPLDCRANEAAAERARTLSEEEFPMRVGVPTEIKKNEHRIGLTPTAVREYVAHGHAVSVQKGAGLGAGFTDEDYTKVGATIAATAAEIFANADMIVKVKEPQKVEWEMLREDQILFTYLHLAPDPEQTKGLLASKCAAIAYETVTDAKGGLPLLAPMSEVAGRIAVFSAAETLLKHNGGMGLLFCGVPGVAPARVLVLGGGVVGLNAARMAMGLGAEVVVLERSIPRMAYIDEVTQGRVITRYSSINAIDEEMVKADVIIGAVLVPGASAPKLIKREDLKAMKNGSVLVDVAIDQGGCFETSKATTHEDPTYVIDGVVHYCVANMPGAAPRTSSEALNNATLPFGLALANKGLEALKADPHLARGLNVLKGEITYPAVAEAMGLGWSDPFGVWAKG